MKRIVHYLNQFYGQIGGEEYAGQTPILRSGPVGPGTALRELLSADGEIVGTVICGDNYFADHQEDALRQILEMIEKLAPNLLIAGPGFNAGRYGLACGAVCDAVGKRLNIPTLTALHPENPGAEMFHKTVYIMEAPASAAGMRELLPKVGAFAGKLLRGEKIGFPEEEGYIPHGCRINVHTEKTGAVRSVDMLLKKLHGDPFTTELPMPVFDRVKPAPAVRDLKKAKIALVTSGGIVPQGNPDKIESANASKFGIYDIASVDDLTRERFMTVHGGYDPVYATEDPDRVLPLDALRLFEKEGLIGELHGQYYATVGNTTAVSNARKYGEEIAKDMLQKGIQAAILTSN